MVIQLVSAPPAFRKHDYTGISNVISGVTRLQAFDARAFNGFSSKNGHTAMSHAASETVLQPASVTSQHVTDERSWLCSRFYRQVGRPRCLARRPGGENSHRGCRPQRRVVGQHSRWWRVRQELVAPHPPPPHIPGSRAEYGVMVRELRSSLPCPKSTTVSTRRRSSAA